MIKKLTSLLLLPILCCALWCMPASATTKIQIPLFCDTEFEAVVLSPRGYSALLVAPSSQFFYTDILLNGAKLHVVALQKNRKESVIYAKTEYNQHTGWVQLHDLKPVNTKKEITEAERQFFSDEKAIEEKKPKKNPFAERIRE